VSRALELNPEQSSAQTLYAQLETDLGRARDAMVRLLDRARHRELDPEPFVGLCHACRYCGLLDESAAAHDRAQRLDSTVVTSVVHTYFVRGDYQRLVEVTEQSAGGYTYVALIALARIGRDADALAGARPMEATAPAHFRALIPAARAYVEGKVAESVEALDETVRRFTDPEVFFYAGRQFAHLGETRRALDSLARAVAGGYFGLWRGKGDAWFDPLRNEPEFARLVDQSRAGHDSALAAFRDAQGARILIGR
jgi:predicted Zn-dependent protease